MLGGMGRRLTFIAPTAALALVLLIWPGTSSAACKTDIEGTSVRSSVNCHVTSVVLIKAGRRIAAGRHHFTVYARGRWHCDVFPYEGMTTLTCNRRRGIIVAVTEAG